MEGHTCGVVMSVLCEGMGFERTEVEKEGSGCTCDLSTRGMTLNLLACLMRRSP